MYVLKPLGNEHLENPWLYIHIRIMAGWVTELEADPKVTITSICLTQSKPKKGQ